jgi:hypothetical protein
VVVLDELVPLDGALDALALHFSDRECHARPGGFTESARGSR